MRNLGARYPTEDRRGELDGSRTQIFEPESKEREKQNIALDREVFLRIFRAIRQVLHSHVSYMW